MNAETPTILSIIGITGDLSKRKLLPAIGVLAKAGLLPKQLRIVGITRQKTVALDSILEGVANEEHIRARMELFPMSLTDSAEYARLRARILDIGKEWGSATQHLWYLSVPPQTAWPIIEQLGNSGLAKAPNTKLLLEKPFGVDEKSARELEAHIEQSFNIEDIYRIDHYLAKEAVQDILALRRNDASFENSLRRDSVERIDILASETLGIEGRTVFYEQTGALQDVIQSHLLQLAAIMLMTLPKNGKEEIPKARYRALQKLEMAPDHIFRGQYEGYRTEVRNPDSTVETFVSLTLFSKDPRWRNVPITLTTGKALSEKKTAIVITRRKRAAQENSFTLRVQPSKKEPRYDAYEHIFLAALCGDHALFVSSDEVYESWRIVDAARKEWDIHPNTLISYQKGAMVERVFKNSILH